MVRLQRAAPGTTESRAGAGRARMPVPSKSLKTYLEPGAHPAREGPQPCLGWERSGVCHCGPDGSSIWSSPEESGHEYGAVFPDTAAGGGPGTVCRHGCVRNQALAHSSAAHTSYCWLKRKGHVVGLGGGGCCRRPSFGGGGAVGGATRCQSQEERGSLIHSLQEEDTEVSLSSMIFTRRERGLGLLSPDAREAKLPAAPASPWCERWPPDKPSCVHHQVSTPPLPPPCFVMRTSSSTSTSSIRIAMLPSNS